MIICTLSVEPWTDQKLEPCIPRAESIVEVAHRVREDPVDATANVYNRLRDQCHVHVQRLAADAVIGWGYEFEAGAMNRTCPHTPAVSWGFGVGGASCADDDRWIARLFC